MFFTDIWPPGLFMSLKCIIIIIIIIIIVKHTNKDVNSKWYIERGRKLVAI